MIFLPVAGSGTRVSDNMILLPLDNSGGRRYLLDEIATPSAAAYGWDPMSASYTDPTCVVFTDGGTVDCFSSAEVKALMALNDCFLANRKDQSGNGFDQVQATEADMPQIFEDENGYLYFDGVSGNFVRADPFIGAQTNSTMHILWQTVSAPATAPQANTFQGSMDFSDQVAGLFVGWWQGNQSPTKGALSGGPFNWIDNKPRQHVFKWLNGTETSFEFASNGRLTNTLPNPTYARLTQGKTDFQPGNSRFYETVFWPADVDENIIFQVTKANYPLMFNVGHLRISVGDSNTAAGFVGTSLQWTSKVYATEGYTNMSPSRALGGRTIQDFLNHPEDLEFYFENFTYTDSTAIIFLGTNDIVVNGTSGADTFDLLKDLAAVFRNAGCQTIAAITMLPRTANPPFDDERDIFNDLLIANTEGVFDVVIDTTTNPNLQDQNDTTYFVDTTHLSATGQTELANMVAAAL